MQRIIIVLACSLLVMSCAQSSTKEKELASQENELLQKQQDTAVSKTINAEPATAADTATALVVSPLSTSGDLGQVTFSQKDNTIFYYNLKTKKGEIRLNGVNHTLNNYAYNSTSGTYTLSGKGLSITAPNCKYKESEGGDCSYGRFAEVTITLGTGVLVLNKVEVQDCPDY